MLLLTFWLSEAYNIWTLGGGRGGKGKGETEENGGERLLTQYGQVMPEHDLLSLSKSYNFIKEHFYRILCEHNGKPLLASSFYDSKPRRGCGWCSHPYCEYYKTTGIHTSSTKYSCCTVLPYDMLSPFYSMLPDNIDLLFPKVSAKPSSKYSLWTFSRQSKNACIKLSCATKWRQEVKMYLSLSQ